MSVSLSITWFKYIHIRVESLFESVGVSVFMLIFLCTFLLVHFYSYVNFIFIFLVIHHVHTTCSCCRFMQHVRVAETCGMNIQHGDMDMQHGHIHGHVHAAWTWTVQNEHKQSAWTWTCSKDMDMQHWHGHAAGIWTSTWTLTWTWTRTLTWTWTWTWIWTWAMDMDTGVDMDMDMDMDMNMDMDTGIDYDWTGSVCLWKRKETSEGKWSDKNRENRTICFVKTSETEAKLITFVSFCFESEKNEVKPGAPKGSHRDFILHIYKIFSRIRN